MLYRYIYCEKANITVDTAFPLMYAAKKYLLTGLVKKCRTVLEKELSVDTVCTMLEQSLSFQEDELKKKSLTFISKCAPRVLNTEEFLCLSYDALEEIVGLDALAVTSERQVYENCVKWARHQLLELGNDSPSDEEIREKLGNILYKIRFPTMTRKDFADLTAGSTILTAEEQRDVYVNMTGVRLETLKFVAERRQMVEMDQNVISRFDSVGNGHWSCGGATDAISFETSVDIYLTGIGLYGGNTASTHGVTLKVLSANKCLSTVETKMTSNGSQKPIKIELKNSVHIHANNKYTVAATIKGPQTWCGENGKTVHYFPDSGRVVSVWYVWQLLKRE